MADTVVKLIVDLDADTKKLLKQAVAAAGKIAAAAPPEESEPPSEELSETPSEEASEPSDMLGEITIEDVRTAFRGLMKKTNRDTALGLLKKVGGVSSFANLAKDKYQKAIDAATKATKAAK